MHLIGLFLFSLIFLFWIVQGLRITRGALRLPHLENQAPCETSCPSITLIFGARDEEEKLPRALSTLAEVDYPALEIIAVNDRSSDTTPTILREAARRDSRLKIVHVENLPEGWLGKPHALQKGYEGSKGEWLLFTDADVCFKPASLRRAMGMAQGLGLDHLTLMGDIEMHGFWEEDRADIFRLGLLHRHEPSRRLRPEFKGISGRRSLSTSKEIRI